MAQGTKDLKDFVDKHAQTSHLRVESDLGGGYFRLRASEAQRRQAQQDIRSVEDAVIELLRNSRDAGAHNIYLATNTEEAFRHILVIDDGSCRHYVLHFLDRDDEAKEWLEKIIQDNPFESGNWYDKACLFSRMGLLDEAVAALEKALEMGFCSFGHIEHDDDLDPIREREDFKKMVDTYSEKLQERIKAFYEESEEKKDTLITEVSISRHSGGTFEVPCSVNGLNLNMLFDTGASDVTISSVEANFMLKNDYLSVSDIKGKKYYQIANGDLTEGTVITLKEVKVGNAVLRNVDASVVKSQKAPLLLGQSVMERFGTITIDNINSKLIIKQ